MDMQEQFEAWFNDTDFAKAKALNLVDPETARKVFENVWGIAWQTAIKVETGGDMWLCESRSLNLKPGTLYRFKVDPDCQSCKTCAEEALIPGESLPPAPKP